MTEDEVEKLITYLSLHPTAGDEMAGTGGCRKLRIAKEGMGKRGGYRTITFYSGLNLPIFLITVFGKNERADLTQKERNSLLGMSKALVVDYTGRVVKVRDNEQKSVRKDR